MFYHYSYWTFGEFDASTMLGRLGCVSFFYILSGLALYTDYKDYPISIRLAILFGIKRFVRIYPLIWIVSIFGTLIASFLSYQYLEKPMIHVGARVIQRIRNQSTLS